MRRKGMNKGSKILITKMNEIISIVSKLQCTLESLGKLEQTNVS